MAGRHTRGAGLTHARMDLPKRTRKLLGLALATFVLAGATLAALAVSSGGATPPPNILFIVTDDQRADGTMDVMPQTLQWFANGGTTFPNAYATTTSCCPSRASIFTGKYTHNHNVRTNDASQNMDPRFTMQHYLKTNGYATALYGKYFNAWNLNRNPADFDNWAIWVQGYGPPIRMNEQGVVKSVSKYATTYVSDAGVNFIQNQENNDSQPWFMELAVTAPHSPFQPDTAYANAPTPPYNPKPSYFEPDRSDKPPEIQARKDNEATVLSDRIQQLRTLMSVDDMVGRVMQTLEATGEASNTIAVFVSDNGYSWGEHGLEAKGEPYTESVKIPMYLRWPGHVAAGATDNRLVANLDLPETALDAAGVTPTVPMDGHSLLSGYSRDHLLLDLYGDLGDSVGKQRAWASLVSPTYQYTRWYTHGTNESATRFAEYYDEVNDPYQLTNLLNDGNAANDPNVGSLDAQLTKDLSCSGSTCP
jgi:arylsulfatase A-like enzyme